MSASDPSDSRRLFRSNLFRLQVDKLLAHADKLNSKKARAHPEQALRELYTAIKAVPSTEVAADFSAQFGGRGFAFYNSDESRRKGFAFQAPSRLEVAGSFLLKTVTEPVVDLALFLPEAMFVSKDHVNYRYGRMMGEDEDIL